MGAAGWPRAGRGGPQVWDRTPEVYSATMSGVRPLSGARGTAGLEGNRLGKLGRAAQRELDGRAGRPETLPPGRRSSWKSLGPQTLQEGTPETGAGARGSPVETTRAAKMAKATQQVFAEDMSEEKVDFCLEIATDAFNQASFQGKVYSYVANFIRAALEKQYGKGWNVVVGKSFGAFVTHEIKTYFYGSVVPGVCVLIWRCEGEPPECDRDGMPISVETEDK